LLAAERDRRLRHRAQVVEAIARLDEVRPPVGAHRESIEVALLGDLRQHLDDADDVGAEAVLEQLGLERRVLECVVENRRAHRVEADDLLEVDADQRRAANVLEVAERLAVLVDLILGSWRSAPMRVLRQEYARRSCADAFGATTGLMRSKDVAPFSTACGL